MRKRRTRVLHPLICTLKYMNFDIFIAQYATFDEEIQNRPGQVKTNEQQLSLSNNLYGKRVNYATMPLMGGMYGKRMIVPLHGGMYGKRRLLLPSSVHYSKRALIPEIIQNNEFAKFALSSYYDMSGNLGRNSYQKRQRQHLSGNDDKTNCIPPSTPTKDKRGIDCCKLPPEPFPHKTIYEEFCDPVYFGVMANGPDGRFCRLSSIQKKQSTDCDIGWTKFYEGFNQFCYKAFSITSSKDAIDISSKKDGDPCEKQRKTARLVRVPNPSINIDNESVGSGHFSVKILNGAQNLSCTVQDANTYYYYIGLNRFIFTWKLKVTGLVDHFGAYLIRLFSFNFDPSIVFDFIVIGNINPNTR
uniref:CPW_WPC domain-containing protein n=1 Tax=Elaeophora elaphi TaxID=1147741 RepID=A0A0R3RL07_9BILA